MLAYGLVIAMVILGCIWYIADSEERRHKQARRQTIGEHIASYDYKK